jgi:hypothetical protein
MSVRSDVALRLKAFGTLHIWPSFSQRVLQTSHCVKIFVTIILQAFSRSGRYDYTVGHTGIDVASQIPQAHA